MHNALLLLGLALCAYLGFALLALAQARQWRRVETADPPKGARRAALCVLAGFALVASLILALLRDGPSFGALLWATAISLAALAVAFTLSWRPAWLRPLAMLATARGRSTTPDTTQAHSD